MKALSILGACLLLASMPSKEFVLENDYVRATVDPAKGGAVTSLQYKKGTVFPLISDKGAGIAGEGRLFFLAGSGEMKSDGIRAEKDEVVLRLSGTLPGLAFERVFRLGNKESGLRISDTFRADKDGTFQLAGQSRQEARSWRLNSRSWFGDGARSDWRAAPYNAGDKTSFEAKTGAFFWRHVGQYGVGFLYRATPPSGVATLTHHYPKENGIPAEFEWKTGEVPLTAGKSLTMESSVLVDEGGREGSNPSSCALENRVILTLDLRAGGNVGQWMPAFATLVSAVPVKATLRIVSCTRYGEKPGAEKTVAEVPVTLDAGKARIHSFDVEPDLKGILFVEATLLGEKGEKLAFASTRSVVEGEGLGGELGGIWSNYVRKIPTSLYKGTWSQIGEQLAKAGRLKAKPADGRSGERKAFYEKHFPFYAELVAGAAAALGVPAEQLVRSVEEAPPGEACMDLFFNGPDGPLNVFSKERSGAGMGGLAYMKVLPDKGYPYHVYECGSWQNGYGVNSEGLSTSGASINCDGGTSEAGHKATQAWKSSGKLVAPLGSHMMLAMCKNVDEAIAFIQNPIAPFEFEGNMLLVDRAGNAARLESVGILRQIRRYDPKTDRQFVAGNYPHQDANGRFAVGPDWGWAANTMMRERHVAELLGPKQGVSLKDAITVMESHAAGGMCQHGFENVGRLYSNTSFIAVCRTSDLWLSHGPPCKSRYTKFSLKED